MSGIVWCDAHNPAGTPLTAATAHAERDECRNPHDVGPTVRSAHRAIAVVRLRRDLPEARPGDDVELLVEHLAAWGPDGLDVQALARELLDRREPEQLDEPAPARPFCEAAAEWDHSWRAVEGEPEQRRCAECGHVERA